MFHNSSKAEREFDMSQFMICKSEACCKQLYYDEFFASELHYLIDNLYDLCEWMISWYSYAVQKMDNIFFVYECEIDEDNMAMEDIFNPKFY